jgi:hypothetical protein
MRVGGAARLTAFASALFIVAGITAGPVFADPIRANSGFGVNQLARNDDGSTGAVSLPFTLNFFDSAHNTAFVNNNGNVTFVTGLGTFTPFGLTSNVGRQIIAPFFADVDTRNVASGVVTYGSDVIDGHQAFGVNYVDVGYFSQNVDKLNSFQVVLIDRSDVGAGDFDIEFNYEDIEWETGEASGGVDGLGGSSARVGYSRGTGVAGTFFELPGSGVNGAFLNGGPNALTTGSFGSSTPGRYLFEVRNGEVDLPGLTPDNPFLPNASIPGGPGQSPVFFFNNVPGTRWFDPPLVPAFQYSADPGTLFTGVQLPSGFGDNFTLSALGCTQSGVGSLTLIDLTTFCPASGGAGLSSFLVSGITPLVDAANPSAFPTFLTFNNPTGSFSMQGIAAVPEPLTALLIGAGLAGVTRNRMKGRARRP